jgi:ABC-type branched-subunit amino acid transport system ATPase component
VALLEVRGLRRHFGGVAALDGADLAVERGSITGLIGPNGAGKTTLFNVVSGVLAPHGGEVRLDGTNVTGWRPDRLARIGLARTFQIARGLLRLTVLENLLLFGKSQPGERLSLALLAAAGVASRERELLDTAWTIVERLKLARVADNPASDLSGGQKKLLELGRALMGEPRLILLDEPAAGVNPSLAREISAHILDLRAHGHTFLIIEHNMGVIAHLCDTVVVLAEGKRLTEGSFAAVSADRRVQEAYMGLGRRA